MTNIVGLVFIKHVLSTLGQLKLYNFSKILFVQTQLKDSLKSVCQVNIFRKIHDSEEDDSGNYLYYEFLQMGEL